MSKMTEWRKNNPEKAAAQKAAYKERQRAANAAYEHRNAERRKVMRKENYEAYKPRRKYMQECKREYLRDVARAWRAENPEKSKNSVTAWRLANKDRVREIVRARRARVMCAPGSLSRGISSSLMAAQKGRCAVCGCSLKKSGHHLDHVVALSRGGANIDSNVQLLCPSCNCSKNARDQIEFMQSRGFLL